MNTVNSTLEALRASLSADLARDIGCNIQEIPTSVPLEVGCKFLGLTNKKTFHVWKATKRHPLVWMRKGQALEIGSQSLIELRLSQVEVTEAAA